MASRAPSARAAQVGFARLGLWVTPRSEIVVPGAPSGSAEHVSDVLQRARARRKLRREEFHRASGHHTTVAQGLKDGSNPDYAVVALATHNHHAEWNLSPRGSRSMELSIASGVAEDRPIRHTGHPQKWDRVTSVHLR